MLILVNTYLNLNYNKYKCSHRRLIFIIKQHNIKVLHLFKLNTNNKGLSKPLIEEPLNVKLAYSTAYGKTADDNTDEDNTPYTSSLSNYFKKKGLSIRDILHNTSLRVRKGTEGKQVPAHHFGMLVEDLQLIKVVD